MRIEPVSPYRLSRFVVPIQQAVNQASIQESQGKAPPTLSEEDFTDQSLKGLENELEEIGGSPTLLSTDTGKVDNVAAKQFIVPEYDAEMEMAEARFHMGKRLEEPMVFFPETPGYRANAISAIHGYGVTHNPYLPSREVNRDRFSYFTLVEAMLIQNILYQDLPEGRAKFAYSTHSIHEDRQVLESDLHLYKGLKTLKRYQLNYHVKKHHYDLFDEKTKKKIGDVDFDLDPNNFVMEEALGEVDGHSLRLDPVWDNEKIKYQILQIGHRKLDLTLTSPHHRKGQWSFQGMEAPILFEEMFESRETRKEHILTTKSITVGKSVINLTLKFLDDIFPEPYAGAGVLRVDY